ncbi:MAG: SDR family NAD(P)-dependent oxidoreductase [Anaerolineaceae bacterium]|nr:SDR family NAD(P)-dependent oxidoreductase [Anaerolineaceae bacterium]
MKTALITGASRGLGLALARELAAQGWGLIIDARGEEALHAAKQQLASAARIVTIGGDVSRPEHRQQLAQAAADLGGLDAVINNASVLGPSPQPNLLDYPLDELEAVYKTNVIAPLAILQAVKARLHPDARIINISSDAGIEPYAGWGGYGSSKAALEQMSAILAAENPQWRVFWVDPGDMRTEMHQAAFPGEDISDRPLPEVSVPGLVALLSDDYPSGRYRARTVLEPKPEAPPVNGLNLVLQVQDFEDAADFFGKHLNLPIQKEWHDTGHGALFSAGQATIEIADAAQIAEVDRVEVGHAVNDSIRLALGVRDVHQASTDVQAGGAEALHAVVDTDWGHRNQRLSLPDNLPVKALTLFQVIEPNGKDQS